MQYTTNYGLKEPQYADEADIEKINENTEAIDNLIHQNRTMIAPAFDNTKAYVTGDPVEYLGALYVFTSDKAAGAWDASKVEPTTAAEMGGGTEVVANPSGTATAELTKIDIGGTKYNTNDATARTQLNAMKTGFDGVVYNSPAAMVTGEDQKIYTKIETDRDDYSKAVIGRNSYYNSSIGRTNNYYISDTGEITSQSGYFYTDPIALSVGNYTLYYTVNGQSVVRVHGYKNGTWVKLILKTLGSVAPQKITIDDSMDSIRITVNGNTTTINLLVSESESVQYQINSAQAQITRMEPYTDGLDTKDVASITDPNLNFTRGYYITNKGVLASNNDFGYSDMMKVVPGTVITYSLNGSANYSLLAKYDINQTFQGQIAVGAGYRSWQTGTYTSDFTGYVRMCTQFYGANKAFTMSTAMPYRIATMKTEINSLDSRVSTLEGGGTNILDIHPDHEMLPIMKNMKQRLKNSSFVNLDEQLLLLHFTDIHGDGTNLGRIIDFKEHYSTYINDIIHTGDALYEKWSNSFDFWSNLEGSEYILNCIGNHDVYSPEATITEQDIYNRFFKPYVSNWDVVQPTDAEANGLMYYYKNYTNQKIRLIVLNCMNYDTDQNNWLINVLADAKTNGYAVIIAEHYPIAMTQFEGCAFQALDNVGKGSASTLLDAQQAVDSFITGGGEFVMWLTGHTHKDFTGVITAYPNQFIFTSDLASMNHTGWSDTARATGEYTQDLFNLIGIDRTTKTVRIYRIGACYDRYMKHKLSMVIDYANGEMIWSS